MSSLSSSSRRPRSFPIAILRPGEEVSSSARPTARDLDSDDEEFALEQGMDALSLASGTYVGSVPTKLRGIRRRPNNADMSKSLPGAPLLVSRSFEMGNRNGNFPPPMTLTGNTDSELQGVADPSYGSLRESHLEGKFVDGPASYRDRSGQIHALRHNEKVRLDDSATSYHAPRLLLPPRKNQVSWAKASAKDTTNSSDAVATPVERINMVTSASPSDHKPATTSSLASMMQDPPPQALTHTAGGLGFAESHMYQDHYSNNNNHNHEESMLSTSLTGLEVLHAARGRNLSIPDQNQITSSPTELHFGSPTAFSSPPATIHSSFSPQQQEDDEGEEFFQLDME